MGKLHTHTLKIYFKTYFSQINIPKNGLGLCELKQKLSNDFGTYT